MPENNQNQTASVIGGLVSYRETEQRGGHGEYLSRAEREEQKKEKLAATLNTTPNGKRAYKSDDWMSEGACRGANPDTFFPDNQEEELLAKRVCSGCPVIKQCLLYGIDNAEAFGIWGGRNPQELKTISRKVPRKNIYSDKTDQILERIVSKPVFETAPAKRLSRAEQLKQRNTLIYEEVSSHKSFTEISEMFGIPVDEVKKVFKKVQEERIDEMFEKM